MASVLPIPAQTGSVRHSCGEMNPPEAVFCGGCGCDLQHASTCGACGSAGQPGARFCNGCGARLIAWAGSGADIGEGRVAALEAEVAGMREEMEGLLILKAQLDSAMQRIKQKGGAGARPATAPKPAPPKAGAETKPETTAAAPGESAGATPSEVGAEGASAEPGTAEAGAPNNEAHTIAVLHFEDRPDFQDIVQGVLAPYKSTTYHPESSLAEDLPNGRPLLMINLLSENDPLGAITDERLRQVQPRAFVYATDGKRGFVLGMVDLFSPPFDPASCAQRILLAVGTSPRILVVSEAVIGAPELRGHLMRQGCTTSVAFDEKQALGLIPSVRPNLVLIDLNLPRGEGLRLAGRIRSDERNRSIRLGFLWQQAIEPASFRQFVTRATNDFRFSEDDLKRHLLQEFNPGGAAYLSGV